MRCATLERGEELMEPSAFDLPACLARVRHGSEESARALVGHLYPFVASIVRTRLPRRGSEEDLVQEVFIKMFSKLDQYSGAVPFEHWLSRITVNHCLNAIRAQQIRPEYRCADLTVEQVWALEAVAGSALDEADPTHALAARELVDGLLGSLAPEDQLIMRLMEIEDRTVEEVCKMTGWSGTKVRVRAFRARRKLNQKFSELRAKGKL